MNPPASGGIGPTLLAERPELAIEPERQFGGGGPGDGDGGHGGGDDGGGGGGWGRGDDGGAARRWYHPSGRTLLRAVAAVIVIGSFGIWGYAFSGKAGRRTPDTLDDPTFAQVAEAQCAAALADLSALPQSYDARNGQERSAQVLQSTARLQALVDQLRGEVTGSARDRAILGDWLDNWQIVIGDRTRYAQAVAVDPAAPYLQTDIKVNEFLNTRVTRMADTNRMPSCAVPDDVG